MLDHLINNSIDTPWKLSNKIWQWITLPWIHLQFFINGIAWGTNWRFVGVPIIQKHRLSVMSFGDGLSLRSTTRSNPLGPYHPVILCTWLAGSVLHIGDNFGMTGGSIVAAENITIGDRVIVGANTIITDTDFHPLDYVQRKVHPQDGSINPINIGNDIFIGMNCIILKGVKIGDGSVVGAGSVVTKDIPPGTISGGNPARIIGTVH